VLSAIKSDSIFSLAFLYLLLLPRHVVTRHDRHGLALALLRVTVGIAGNDSASNSAAGISGRLRLEVVGIGVNDQSAANDAVRAVAESDAAVYLDGSHHISVRIRRQVPEIAAMAFGSGRSPMIGCGRIEVSAGAGTISRGTVAALVNVNPVRRIRGQAAKVGGDKHRAALAHEVDRAADRITGGRLQHSHGRRILVARPALIATCARRQQQCGYAQR
jgi:hypothetical protein